MEECNHLVVNHHQVKQNVYRTITEGIKAV